LFRSQLDQIIDTIHALVALARSIEWRFLEEKLGPLSKSRWPCVVADAIGGAA